MPESKRKRGRKPLDRAPWNPDTFALIARTLFSSSGAVAEELGLPAYLVYHWQSTAMSAAPTPNEAKAIAELFSRVSGQRIRPSDLGKPVSRVRFTFGE